MVQIQPFNYTTFVQKLKLYIFPTLNINNKHLTTYNYTLFLQGSKTKLLKYKTQKLILNNSQEPEETNEATEEIEATTEEAVPEVINEEQENVDISPILDHNEMVRFIFLFFCLSVVEKKTA